MKKIMLLQLCGFCFLGLDAQSVWIGKTMRCFIGSATSVSVKDSSAIHGNLVNKGALYFGSKVSFESESVSSNECGSIVVEDTVHVAGDFTNAGFLWSKELLHIDGGTFVQEEGGVTRTVDVTNQGSFTGEGRLYIERLSKQEGICAGSSPSHPLVVYDITPARSPYAFDMPLSGSQNYTNIVISSFNAPTLATYISVCDLFVLPLSRFDLHAIAIGTQIFVTWRDARSVEVSYDKMYSWRPIVMTYAPSGNVRFTPNSNGVMYIKAIGFSEREQRIVAIDIAGNKPVQLFTTSLQYLGVAHRYEDIPKRRMVVVRGYKGRGMRIVRE